MVDRVGAVDPRRPPVRRCPHRSTSRPAPHWGSPTAGPPRPANGRSGLAPTRRPLVVVPEARGVDRVEPSRTGRIGEPRQQPLAILEEHAGRHPGRALPPARLPRSPTPAPSGSRGATSWAEQSQPPPPLRRRPCWVSARQPAPPTAARRTGHHRDQERRQPPAGRLVHADQWKRAVAPGLALEVRADDAQLVLRHD